MVGYEQKEDIRTSPCVKNFEADMNNLLILWVDMKNPPNEWADYTYLEHLAILQTVRKEEVSQLGRDLGLQENSIQITA